MSSLSVIITYYNKGGFLLGAIDSVLNQKYDCEIIIVDDCSNEKESIELFLFAKKQYPRIQFYQTSCNLGASGAKNYGIEKASGDIIVLLDADDKLPSAALLYISQFFDKYPDTDLLFGNYIVEQSSLEHRITIDCSWIAQDGYLNPYKVAEDWSLLGSSPFLKKAWKDVCGFDPLFPKTDDIDFHIRMILSSKKIRYINETIYQWNRGNTGNFTSKTKLDSAYSVFRNMKFYYIYLNKVNFILKLSKNFLVFFIKKTFK